MFRTSGKSLSTRSRVLLIAAEVVIFVIIVAVLVLRQDHYFSVSGPRPHVVIFLVDALRADHLGCYGHPVPTSPYLDRLARKGVLFEKCRSQAPWTKPSVASLFTSLYSSAHRVIALPRIRGSAIDQDIGRYDLLPDQIITLAEILRENRYHTAAFTTNRWVDPVFGFHQGFDEFFALTKSMPPRADGKRVIVLNLPADYLHEKLREFLLKQGPAAWERWLAKIGIYKKPFFLYLHYMDVHGPYHPPAPFSNMFDGIYAGWPDQPLSAEDIDNMDYLYQDVNSLNFYRSRYDAQIRFFDHELESLLKWINNNDLLSPAIMILTADHGEAFREHGEFDHGNTLYEEEIHVPLIIWGTPEFASGTRVAEAVQLIDVAPTILDALDFSCPDQFEGTSLLSLISGGKGTQRSLHPSWSENYSHGKSQVTQIENGGKWFFDVSGDRLTEFYDLGNDPGEIFNRINSLSSKEIQGRAIRMRAWRTEEMKRIEIKEEVPEAVMTDDIRRQLEALGYIGKGKESR
jgi:arylsulfatase A-like enzyme